jgi:hypothetical protein
MDWNYYRNIAKLGGCIVAACYGGDTKEDLECDAQGILPFELPNGEVRLFCRLHLHRRRVQAAEERLKDEMYTKQYGPSQEKSA